MEATTPGNNAPTGSDGQRRSFADVGDEHRRDGQQNRRSKKTSEARAKPRPGGLEPPPGGLEPPGQFSWPAARAPGLVTPAAAQNSRNAQNVPVVSAQSPYAMYVPAVPAPAVQGKGSSRYAVNAAYAAQAAAQTAIVQAAALRNAAIYRQAAIMQMQQQALMQQHASMASRSSEQQRSKHQPQHGKPESGPIEDQPLYVGVLKTFSPKDGYGFISCPDLKERWPERDVYIHKAQLPDGVSCGCSLEFCLHLNPKGQPQARDVTLVETSPLEVADSISPTSLLLDLGDWEPLPDEAPLRIQSGTHSNSVRICSWNILAVAYANCKAFPDVEPALLAWDRRRALVARALEMMNADVVCLQEVDRPLEDLGLQEYDQVRAQRPDGRADGCTIAWKRGSFTLVNEEVISFDDHLGLDHDQQRFRRGNCAAIAELRRSSSKGERSFLVATTHLCWEADSEDIRQQQANVLLTALEARSRRLGHRTVLCGDLNAMPGCLSHRTITNALPSVYRDLEAEDAVTNSNASAGPAVIHGDDIPGGRENGSRGEASKEKQGFAGMLDYLCMDARGAKVSSRLRLPGRPELRDKLGQGAEGPLPTLLCASWPSDHLPVAADVNFAVVFQ